MRAFVAILALGLSLDAWAGGPSTVPEPDALALFAIGAVGGLALWLRNRNKK